MLNNITISFILIILLTIIVAYNNIFKNTELVVPPFLKSSINFFTSYGSYILLVVGVIFMILVYARSVGWNFNPPVSHHLEKVVIVEGMDKMKKGFCNTLMHNSHKREQACNKLTEENCKSSDCCIFLNGKKCVAGNAHGPVYRSDEKGNKIDVDNYYFKSKCHGKC